MSEDMATWECFEQTEEELDDDDAWMDAYEAELDNAMEREYGLTKEEKQIWDARHR